MTDNRNPGGPFYRGGNDPLRHELGVDPAIRGMNATWGWIAGIVFVAVVLAIIFGVGHRPSDGTIVSTASNDATPPAAIHMAPPAGTSATPTLPAATPTAPSTTPAPVTPTPAPASK